MTVPTINQGSLSLATPNADPFSNIAGGNLAQSSQVTNYNRRWPMRRAPIQRRPTTVHPSPPTITYSATLPTGVHPIMPSSQNVQPIGVAVQTYNPTFSTLDITAAQGAGFEADFTGDVISYAWKCQSSTLERVMVYVDGQPCMATAATPSVSTVAGTIYAVTLTFSASARRKVEIYITNTSAQLAVYVPLTGSIAPSATKPKVLIIGDSFIGGSAAISDYSKLPTGQLAQMFDANFISYGLGGTGYVATGSFVSFGDATRVALATGCDPDRIIFLGSVNDDGLTGIQAAATACFNAYRLAAPNAQIYAFGPQPTNATDTISTSRSANIAAVKAAAAATGVTFYDMCGTAVSVPAAFSAAATYVQNDLVTYRGSVWRCARTTGATYPSGPVTQNWDLMTYDLFGTGKVGSTTGDGNRDVYLYSDGVHPTELACGVLAQRLAAVLTN